MVGLEIHSVICSWWLAASSRKPGFLPALQREKDHYDPRPAEKAALFPPYPARWWEAEVGEDSPLLSSCLTQAAAAALKHSKGTTV